ncbi:hypothetical protein IOQ59_00160 [Pontibacterium sp. N1Y112]|uniref:Uncharacterized protein n=1 Tax=Pontibacterium sinense TaxID=2781979 RepID=A0A8J7JXX7_9GAMM|nr:hypothetical protein [Pontibacterium sinense]MBE9395669.1 hypothetical protein [Pontibacterium sinense]|tara:strand:- start:176 stop:358 length:183 start_codon:yes stop_codon:yes gene_type:complete
MDLIAFMSMVILIITILTLSFGVVAYFLYKLREKRAKKQQQVTYEELREESGDDFIFFEK